MMHFRNLAMPAIIMLALTPACVEKAATASNKAPFVSGLPTEFSKRINGELRDILSREDYPIANVVSVELALPPESGTNGEMLHVLLKSLVPTDTVSSYKPRLGDHDSFMQPETSDVVVNYGSIVEVDQIFLIPRHLCGKDKRLLICNDKRQNVLISSAAMKYVNSAIDAAMVSKKKVALYIPVEL